MYEPIACEAFRAKVNIVEIKTNESINICYVNVYIPKEPDFISDEVLVGREILNKIKLYLNGSWIEIVRF